MQAAKLERQKTLGRERFILVASKGEGEILPRDAEEKSPLRESLLGVKATGRSVGKSMSLPRELDASCQIQRFTRRFVCAGATSGVNCTANMILCAFGGICTVVNSTLRAWSSSFRLRKVTIWSSTQNAGSTGVADQASLYWGATFVQSLDSEKAIAIPAGSAVTGAVVFTPPPILAQLWNTDSTTTVFGIACNKGSVIDVECDLTLCNVFAAPSQTIASGAVGSVYYLALDGHTSNLIQPVSVPTTS